MILFKNINWSNRSYIARKRRKLIEMRNLKIKCEICHKNIATKTKISFSGEVIRMCSKCYKIIKF